MAGRWKSDVKVYYYLFDLLFAGQDLPSSEVYWVTPKLVAEIGFEEWTAENRLRQPRYLGLRTDKDPQDVVKEEPVT